METKFEEQVSWLSGDLILGELQKKQLAVYYQNLLKWNEVMNLTAITEEKAVYEKHFLDSLSILKILSLADLSGRRLIDVGTGAGFPGLVLAICCPDVSVTLMDSLNKRILFLQDTVQKLQLQNVTAIHARAEELARQKNYRENYDFAVSRAVANLSTLCEYDLPFVRVGGSFIAYKSEKAEEEIPMAGKAIAVLGGKLSRIEKFILPQTDYSRTLIRIDKIKRTPAQYPRKAGTPSAKPL